MVHHFRYFNNIHIQSLIFSSIVSIILFIIPFFKKVNQKKYTTFLGYFFLFLKILDIYWRIVFEKEEWFYTIPLNLCNISLIVAGIYLIKRNNTLFNLVYFWFTGAILAIILPGIITYMTKTYVYIFMITHFMEVLAVIYAFTHLDCRVTKKGLYCSLIGYMIIVIIAKVVNRILGTNFMFVDDYIISAVSFIKPFLLYQILLVGLFMLSMIITYTPFYHLDNEQIEEDDIKV